MVEGLIIPPVLWGDDDRAVARHRCRAGPREPALARRRGAGRLAGLAAQHLDAAGAAGAGPGPGDRHPVRLLRDPRAAVGDPRPHDADERARRPLPVLPQPTVPCGVAARGARLGAPPGVPRGRPRPARGAHRRGLRRPGGRGADPRRERADAPVRPTDPAAGRGDAGHRRDPAAPPRPLTPLAPGTAGGSSPGWTTTGALLPRVVAMDGRPPLERLAVALHEQPFVVNAAVTVLVVLFVMVTTGATVDAAGEPGRDVA